MSIKTDIRIADNVFVKMMEMYFKGDIITGHSHVFDHITLLARGSLVMRANGVEHYHKAPKLIITPKEVVHEFEALEHETLLCCIHAVRDGDGVDDIAPQDISEEDATTIIQEYSLTRL
jgi:quercetin dioxygenase-like cupin family protein